MDDDVGFDLAKDVLDALAVSDVHLVVLELPFRTAADRAVEQALRNSGTYRVLTAVPFRLGWTRGTHEIWIANDVSVKQ